MAAITISSTYCSAYLQIGRTSQLREKGWMRRREPLNDWKANYLLCAKVFMLFYHQRTGQLVYYQIGLTADLEAAQVNHEHEEEVKRMSNQLADHRVQLSDRDSQLKQKVGTH